MAVKPLLVPPLNQLPDNVSGLFGNLSGMMSVQSQKEIDDLLNPRPTEQAFIKPSAEAMKTIAEYDNQQQAYQQQMQQRIASQQQQADALLRQQQQMFGQQAKANQKLYDELMKERKKALEEKKKEQGGKLGAGKDGSFILKDVAQQLVNTSEWKSIVSDLQRNDEMELWLKTQENRLRELGVKDEQIIKDEIDLARKVITADTHKYVSDMKSDNTDPLDFVTSLGKSFRNTYRGIGIFLGASDEWAENEKQAVESINQTYSDTILLDQANYNYQRSKSKSANPDEGVIGGFVSGVKDAWNTDSIFSHIVDTSGYIPMALVGGSGISVGLSAVARGVGLAGVGAGKAGLMANMARTVLTADNIGMGTATGILSATDATSGAYDSVMALDFNDPNQLAKAKQTYTEHYGEANWNSLLDQVGGDVNALKKELATQAGRVAGGKAFVTTAPLGLFGVEATIAKIGTGTLAKDAGKRLLTVGANTVSETLEEGFTQLSQNIGARPVTGVSLTDDVGSSASMGALAGGGMAVGSQVADVIAGTKTNRPTFDANALDVNNWVEAGFVDYDRYKQVVGHQFDNIARDTRKLGMTDDEAQQLQQRAYNEIVDNDKIWGRLTEEQQNDLKTYLRLDYGINTNDYAEAELTDEHAVWQRGNLDLAKQLVAEKVANADLLGAYRVKHGVELDQVSPEQVEYFKTLATVLDDMAEYDRNVSTREREAQYIKVRAERVLPNDKLTDLQKRGITAFVQNYLDAGSRRMTDEQQQATDNLNDIHERENGNNEQETTDEQTTADGQSTGQETHRADDEPVHAESGSDVGAGETDEQQSAKRPTTATDGDTQSVGDGATRQDPDTASQAGTTAESATSPDGNDTRHRETPQTGDTLTATTSANASGTPTQSQPARQTNQAGQPTGQTAPNATQTAVGERSPRTAEAKRYSDEQRPVTLAQIRNDLKRRGADIDRATMIEILSDFTSDKMRGLANMEIHRYLEQRTKQKPDDVEVAQYLAKQNLNNFNVLIIDRFGTKKLKSKTVGYLRKTRDSILDAYASIVYKDLQEYKTAPEREARARQQAEQKAQREQEQAERKAFAEQRKAEQQAEKERIAKEKQAEKERLAQEKQAEKERVQAEKQAEKERLAQEKQAEKERIAQEKADEAERKKQEQAKQKHQKAIATAQTAVEQKSLALQKAKQTASDRESDYQSLVDEQTDLKEKVKDLRAKRDDLVKSQKSTQSLLTKANASLAKAEAERKAETRRTEKAQLKQVEARERTAKKTVADQLAQVVRDLNATIKLLDTTNARLTALTSKISSAKKAQTTAKNAVVKAQTALDTANANLQALQEQSDVTQSQTTSISEPVSDTTENANTQDGRLDADTSDETPREVSSDSQPTDSETTQETGNETTGEPDRRVEPTNQTQPQTPVASDGNKAVDTNGKPVVVYRGARHGLGVMSYRGAMFFTDNKKVAEDYVLNGKLHTATLYMANPAITDANGGEWGNVVPNGSKTQYVVDVLENDTLQEENPELFETINNTIYESYEEAEKAAEEWERQGVQNFGVAMQGGLNSTAVSTDAFVRQAKADGHDGVIIRNIIDGARTPSDIYVVFDTNQITPIEDKATTDSLPTDNETTQALSDEQVEQPADEQAEPKQYSIDDFTKALIKVKDDQLANDRALAKKQAKKFAEVTTPVHIVDDMIDKVSNTVADISKAVFDPATGDGRFLLRALHRRTPQIFATTDKKQVAHNIIQAVGTLTGVELQPKNADIARDNLKKTAYELFRLAGIDTTPYEAVIDDVSRTAIINGNTIEPTPDMMVSAYEISEQGVTRKDYRFDKFGDLSVNDYSHSEFIPFAFEQVETTQALSDEVKTSLEREVQQFKEKHPELKPYKDVLEDYWNTHIAGKVSDHYQSLYDGIMQSVAEYAPNLLVAVKEKPVSDTKAGTYVPKFNTVILYPNAKNFQSAERKAMALIHELTHAVTVPNLFKSEFSTEVAVLEAINQQIQSILADTKLNKGLNQTDKALLKYATTNIAELLAVAYSATPSLQKFLNEHIKLDDKFKSYKGGDIISTIVQVFRKLLGLPSQEMDILAQVTDSLIKGIANPVSTIDDGGISWKTLSETQQMQVQFAHQKMHELVLGSDSQLNLVLDDHPDEKAVIDDFVQKSDEFVSTNDFLAQAFDLELFDKKSNFINSLPKKVANAVRTIWNAIKDGIAVVSMALAIGAGTTLVVPNQAQANVPTQQATVQHIVKSNDHQGKQFIVANKQAGTMTVYSPTGQVITSTPALFGKETGDSITDKNTTPSGRYNLKQVRKIKGDEKGAYGGSAQALTLNGQLQENNAGNLAIHRVLTTYKGENRQGRLESKKASDNRISHGCINVPKAWYDEHLDKDTDTVVYVLPETQAGVTGVFKDVPVATSDNMDEAGSKVVEVEADKIRQGMAETTTAPSYKALAPIAFKGLALSSQVAYINPTIINGVSADQLIVPFKQHTPAEMVANGLFDTEPVSGSLRADNGKGMNIYEIATALAGIGLGVRAVGKRRRKLSSKQEQETPTVEQVETPPRDPQDEQADVDTYHNRASDPQAKHTFKNAQAPHRPNKLTEAINRSQWFEYIQNSHQTIAKNADGTFKADTAEYDAFVDILSGFEWAVGDVMSDLTYQQASDGTFNDGLQWRGDVRKKRTGVMDWIMSSMGGATPNFDKLMAENKIARTGYEMDSFIPSKHLSQIRSKSAGAYAQIYKNYIGPLVTKTELLASQLRTDRSELEDDIGRVGTIRHVINEEAPSMWRKWGEMIDRMYEELDYHYKQLANTETRQRYSQADIDAVERLERKTDDEFRALEKTQQMYNGELAWDGVTPLPGGYTLKQAQDELTALQEKYGDDFSTIEAYAKEVVQTVRGMRNFATASGVFSNEDLKVFNDLGFKEYVPLYRKQADPLAVDEEDATAVMSDIQKALMDLPTFQARSLSLVKDLTRYHRKGATSPAENAFTNMKVFSMNMAGRVGQQAWLNTVQQLYEGTVGKPLSASVITDPELLRELNAHHENGKLPGLIRVQPGFERIAGINTNDIKPIVAKGYNADGQLVTFNYYFTDPAIQAEIYANADLNETVFNRVSREIGAITRQSARMMTAYRPVWVIYNWVRDSLERISIMLMRPVKNKKGELVNKWDLTKSYFTHLARLASSSSAQSEIYRYLLTAETRTELQRVLDEAVGEGSINLITSQTEKYSVLGDLKKAHVDRLIEKSAKLMGTTLDKAGLSAIKHGGNKLMDFYVMRLTEVPQVTTALAGYMALQEMGVNKSETAHRVRDQYDPLRVNNKFVNAISPLYPFIRSAMSGNYNLWRSLSAYWHTDHKYASVMYMVGGIASTMIALTMLSGVFGNDEDGVPKLARLPATTLMSGLPIPLEGGGVWSVPVGFGMNKLVYGMGVIGWRQYLGLQTSSESAKQMVGLAVANTSPTAVVTGGRSSENPTIGALLTIAPFLAKPMVEIATNTRAYGGGEIITSETPSDQYDSDQDNFNTPDAYKTWVKSLRELTGIDMRPETARHLLESYSFGPLGAVPKSVLQDRSEKTVGNNARKGEIFGPYLTAIGADMLVQPNALDYAQHTYAMQELRMDLHKKYGVGKSHDDETYEKYANRGKEGGILKEADVVTERAMRDKGVPEHIITYVVNSMRYDTERKKAKKEFEELARQHHELTKTGKSDPQLRMAVQDAYDRLENLTYDYVKENNRAYFQIMQQTQ